MSYFNRLPTLIGTVVFCYTLSIQAAEVCTPITEQAPALPKTDLPQDEELHLLADDALIRQNEGTSVFKGNVFLQKGEQRLQSPVIYYEHQLGKVTVDQPFTFWDKDFVVSGDNLNLILDQQGKMQHAYYWLLDRRGHGQAQEVIRENPEKIELTDSTYTTCDPGKELWSLESKHITLDKTTGLGKAYDVKFRLFNTPVFYTPYLSFPIDDQRKSGFLYPRIGYSNEVGIEVGVPYYWNMAPNYDATITPRVMSRRGILLNTEFRYLLESSGGKMEAEYLPNDNVTDQSRYALALTHNGEIQPRLITDINFNAVSDRKYFEELGNSLTLSSLTHLERRADLVYLGEGWSASGRLQAFQTLDENPAARPYQRMPQILLRTQIPERNRQLNFNGMVEAVRFTRNNDGMTPLPTGNRLDAKFSASYPLRTTGTFLVPQLSLRHTRYQLEETTQDDNIQRNLWTASVDSGLFFERDTDLFNTALLHTLEPRLYYRYTSDEDQSQLPVFDTARYDLSYWQLFRDNDFSGTDRIDDGNQATLGVTTRLLEQQTGLERLRASIGQTYYFRDKQVILPGELANDNPSSAIITELATQVTPQWSGSATLQWDPNDSQTKHTVVHTRYQESPQEILNVSYRMREGRLEQTDLSGYWALNTNWRVMGRWNYSLKNSKDLEEFIGLEYNSCCWATRIISRRYLSNIEGSYASGFYIEFEFKGLGGVGKKADSFLEQSVFGYEDHF